MAECETCGRYFVHSRAAEQHMDALGHWSYPYQCETCNFVFRDEESCNDHMDDYDHWYKDYGCEACTRLFSTAQEARMHMDVMGHWRKHWCSACNRGFENDNNLQMHLRGSAHRADSINCRFCTKGFATASGVVIHVESGSCPRAKNLNRETIYDIIRQNDPHNAITRKQLTWQSEQNVSYIASDASYNGYYYECYLCHKEFRSLQALNQHVGSPVHKQGIYHCPNRACAKPFKTLAQLFQHLESETCGATRFNVVQRRAADLLSGRRMVAF